MDELRLALIGLGIFAIAGILAHGMWTIRKNKTKTDAKQEETADSYQEPQFIISDNDPLLEPAEHQTDKSDTEAIIPELSQPQHRTVIEDDVLVGDTPLYEQSDLQTASATRASASESVADIPAFVPEDNVEKQSYDEDGVGEVRVVDKPARSETKTEPEPSGAEKGLVGGSGYDVPEPPSSLLKQEPIAPSVTQSRVDHDSIPMIDTSIDIDDVPASQAEGMAKKSGALKSEHTRTEVVGGKKAKSESIAEKARKLVGRAGEPKKPASRKRSEATPAKDQIRLDLEASDEQMGSDELSKDQPQQEQEVLILNVKVPEGKVIQGSLLLPTLLTLGFKFGEHNMFHRHAASNGKGPRLFTLANMFNPGIFDIDNMENFNTTGVSLFMILPIEADAHQVFNMMHNAARKMADEFGAQVLDGRRSVLTKQSLQQYVEKIREFERRRMIRRA